MFFDNHTHSTFSPDARTTVEESIAYAVSHGLSGIAFTDHLDLDAPARDNEFKPLSRRMAWEVIHKIGERYGLNLGTHSMRKTCAYHYYRATKDLATIKVWLNHSAERDTLTYIGVTKERVTQAMINFKI